MLSIEIISFDPWDPESTIRLVLPVPDNFKPLKGFSFTEDFHFMGS